VSPSGTVLRKIDPTPTPEQLKLRLEEQARRKETERAAAEQRRKDLALLNTFDSAQEIDVARDRNIEPIMSRIAGARERMKEVDEREQQVLEQMEFYKAGKRKGKNVDAKAQEMPPGLTAELKRVHGERAGLVKAIANDEREIEGVRAKFDADKKRWLALKSGAVAKPEEYLAPTSSPKGGGKAR
jgi:chromosome segregation ATPase